MKPAEMRRMEQEDSIRHGYDFMPEEAEVAILKYEGAELRVIITDHGPFWVVKDVANVLGFSEPHNASRGLDKRTFIIQTRGGRQPVTTVGVDDLLKILYRGKRDGIANFREWVTFTALPGLNPTIEADAR